MFEVAELGLKLSKQEFDQQEPALRTKLLQVQRQLQQSQQSVVIVVAGVEGAGRGAVVNRLTEWLDARGIETHAFWDETDEQRLRPRYWRFWRALPPRGSVGILFGSWYTRPLVLRVNKQGSEADFEQRLQEINEFETMLSRDGVIFIKLWFHMPRQSVEKQLKADAKIRRLRKSPWQGRFLKLFDRFLKVAEIALRTTDREHAPWHVIEATDAQYRDLRTGQIVLELLQQRLAVAGPSPVLPVPAPPVIPAKGGSRTVRSRREATVLDILSPDIALDDLSYMRQLERWQRTLRELTWQAHDQERSTVLVFEGWDAAGKGSVIRRLTRGIDARLCKVITSGKPSDEEAAHHYLWRFWRHVPLAGNVTIYDRSWYGRVLVERVEGYAREEEWRRAYDEINLFEKELCNHDILLLKFWLHISPEEQLRRFNEREQTPWKNHKLTEDDWRNREKWDQYKHAVHDMVAHTSTASLPWHLIPANDKKYARVDVLKTVCKELRKVLKTR